jgi:predicted nucleotidyltransferase
MDFTKLASERLIFKAIVGSRLYGTDTELSDTDYVGVFAPDENLIYGTYNCEQVEISTNSSASNEQNKPDDVDYTCYELRKFIQLASKNSPNIMELLYLPNRNLVVNNDYDKLLELRKLVLSKQIFKTFMGYAIAQEKLLKTKTVRYNALSKMLEYFEKNKDEGTLGEERKNKMIEIYPDFRNKRGDIKQFDASMPFEYVYNNIKREFESYGYRRENIVKHNYECKFASHVIRLLAEGAQLAEERYIDFPLHACEIIHNIKEGNIPEKDFYMILGMFRSSFRRIEQESKLPDHPNYVAINNFQIETIKSIMEAKNG